MRCILMIRDSAHTFVLSFKPVLYMRHTLKETILMQVSRNVLKAPQIARFPCAFHETYPSSQTRPLPSIACRHDIAVRPIMT